MDTESTYKIRATDGAAEVEKGCRMLGLMDESYIIRNRVYAGGGTSPTVKTDGRIFVIKKNNRNRQNGSQD